MSGRRGQRQRIFLTGGTGFVGRVVARRLAERGHALRALVRHRDDGRAAGLRDLGADLVVGDITRQQTIAGALDDCETVVHLVGIIKERPPEVTFERVHTHGTIQVVEAARQAGVRRIVHMSALGARLDGTAYQRTKYEGEEAVRRSGISYAIMRPSVILGLGGEFTRMLLRMVRMLPFTPVIGDGQYRLQPVDVRDVAEASGLAVERENVPDAAWEIAGPHKLTYNRILEIISEELGFRRMRFHVPLTLVQPLVDIASNWRLPTPVNSDQLAMLLEENVIRGEGNALRDTFGIEPNSLRSIVRELSG